MLSRLRLSSSRRLRPSYLFSFARYPAFYRLKSTSSEDSGPDVDFGDYSIILPEEPFVWGVAHITPRNVPDNIERPPYAQPGYTETGCHSSTGRTIPERIALGGEANARLRDAANLARKVRDYAGTLIKPGVTTNSIDASVHEFIIAHAAYPSPLLYQNFPRSICTSINNIIVHGIPDEYVNNVSVPVTHRELSSSRPLHDGDIINIDVTIYLNGYHGDTSQTFLVGNVDEQGRELVRLTNDALRAGIDACGPGRPFRNIGKAIHELTRNNNYSISTQFTGHGIGTVFHRPPWILHHLNDEPGVMLPGDCFTIEASGVFSRVLPLPLIQSVTASHLSFKARIPGVGSSLMDGLLQQRTARVVLKQNTWY
ncbi:hypothetical protein H2248_006895 [Termitomyces sp. 'cryptogamus']|nr:hypothetical protein H2248_006895 [Termitomyces sp. 'cryptogamus']